MCLIIKEVISIHVESGGIRKKTDVTYAKVCLTASGTIKLIIGNVGVDNQSVI
jgi:hypothetical protein